MERQTGLEPACICFADSCLAFQQHWRLKITNACGVSTAQHGNDLYRAQYQYRYSKLLVARNKDEVLHSILEYSAVGLQLE